MKIIVNKAGGVYTVFTDPMTRQTVRKDSPIVNSCVPSTLLKLEHVYQNYGKDNVEIIDFDPPPAEQKTVNVSDEEINRYLVDMPKSSVSKDLLAIFREGCILSKYNKAYVNGMAHIVLNIDPNLKEQLIEVAKNKKVNRQHDLI